MIKVRPQVVWNWNKATKEWKTREEKKQEKLDDKKAKAEKKDRLIAATVKAELEEKGIVKFKVRHVVQRLADLKKGEVKFRRQDIARILKSHFCMAFGHLFQVDYVK